MTSVEKTLKVPIILHDAALRRAFISFEGRFNGYVSSLIRADLADVDATAEEFFPLLHTGGNYRDMVDREIARRFMVRAETMRPREMMMPMFFVQPRRHP